MDDSELLRYSRQMILPDWGADGQVALREATALVVGAGGLGSPAAMYLAAAGIGRLLIVDDDKVELANLQRQLLHDSNDVGRPKTESASERLAAINPLVELEVFRERLTEDNARAWMTECDVVIDGSDNFRTRYAVNGACVREGKPLVTGSVIQWRGQITVLRADRGGPCYGCLFPPKAEEEEAPCAEAGIVAPLPGIIGSMQALEAMKLIAGIGDGLEGRLLTFDARSARWSERRYERDPGCPVCSCARSAE